MNLEPPFPQIDEELLEEARELAQSVSFDSIEFRMYHALVQARTRDMILTDIIVDMAVVDYLDSRGIA